MGVAGAADAAASKLDKAAEFLLMAEVALDGQCYDAAVSLAVSSGGNSNRSQDLIGWMSGCRAPDSRSGARN